MERRKVLFTYGMSSDAMIIITDAPIRIGMTMSRLHWMLVMKNLLIKMEMITLSIVNIIATMEDGIMYFKDAFFQAERR